jgi:hypothetical protein
VSARLTKAIGLAAFFWAATGAAAWEPIRSAPVGEPVLVLVPGREAPVVAVCDAAGDWQAVWNGDLLFGATHWTPLPPGLSGPSSCAG